MEPEQKHPLATTQSQAAFTIAALFWAVGLAMIDPRTGVGVLLCVIGIAATFWLFWSSLKLIPFTEPKKWPWLGLILLILQVCIPTYMLIARPPEHIEQASAASSIKTDDASKAISFAKADTGDHPKLLLECQLKSLPPTGLPKQTTLIMIEPFRFDKEGTIGFSGTPTEPGQPIKWPDEWKDKMASSARCHLTNYGRDTLFNVALPFKVRFVKISRGKEPGSTNVNETINVAESELPITKIEPGDDEAYIFYIHNQGRDVIQTVFSNVARFLPPDSTTWKPITVVQSASIIHQPGSLWPTRSIEQILAEEDAKSPPAPPLPVPAPPDTPEKK